MIMNTVNEGCYFQMILGLSKIKQDNCNIKALHSQQQEDLLYSKAQGEDPKKAKKHPFNKEGNHRCVCLRHSSVIITG